MRFKKISSASLSYAVIFLLLDLLCRFLTISTHTGNILNFSLRHAITPLLGIWGGIIPVFILFISKGLIHIYTAMGSRLLLFWHLPTLCGTLYFYLIRKNTLITTVLAALPALFCIILFWVHPVGRHAMLYPLYWFIPIAVALTRQKSFFLQALGSTFTTHAVGSILWLYGGLLVSPAAWTALIPIVFFERFGFACLMTSFFYGVKNSRSWFKRITKPLCISYAQSFRTRRIP